MGLPPVAKLASVTGELALQAPGHLVERRGHVLPRRLGPEHSARGGAGHLDAVATVDPGVGFLGDLDLEPRHPGVDTGELAELLLGGLADLIGDPDAAALDYQIHPVTSPPPASSGSEGKAPAWLTWSLAPHSPAE